uniref:Uncharacterized protein n=1 Tax=Oncorhynchus kisutch TaxID=8019 RepID=A0A8C7IWK3_ONCKI
MELLELLLELLELLELLLELLFGPTAVSGRVGSAAVPGRIGPAAVPGRFGPTSVSGRVGSAAVPGRIGPAAVPGRVGPAAVPGRFGPAAVPGRFGPAAVPERVGPAAVPGRVGLAVVIVMTSVYLTSLALFVDRVTVKRLQYPVRRYTTFQGPTGIPARVGPAAVTGRLGPAAAIVMTFVHLTILELFVDRESVTGLQYPVRRYTTFRLCWSRSVTTGLWLSVVLFWRSIVNIGLP